MARKGRAFGLEYKSEAVRRVGERRLTGATGVQVARELGVRPELLRRWAKEYGGKSRAEVVAAADLEVENRRLRRENETLRQERDFAKNDRARAAPPVAPETRRRYCLAPERRGRLLIGVVRARQKTWSGGGLRTCEW